jgi:hypothetical protein
MDIGELLGALNLLLEALIAPPKSCNYVHIITMFVQALFLLPRENKILNFCLSLQRL